MLRYSIPLAAGLLWLMSPLMPAAAADAHDAIAAAIANPNRPASDTKQDADRKPAQVLEFAEVQPGAKVADFIPGGGYMTRLFSKVVGPQGHVYALVPSEILSMRKDADRAVNDIAASPDYHNITVLRQSVEAFAPPEPLDLVWTSMNYHDMHDSFFGPADLAKVNKAIFDALKPGGIYIVMDHAAAPGSGLRDTETLHRIDPAVVKKEVTAAGFVLEAESGVLHNPADKHTAKVFDPAIRGKTDKFLFRFRKPAVADAK
jgi:predicted methyltransferase